jgi:hypothetical protein
MSKGQNSTLQITQNHRSQFSDEFCSCAPLPQELQQKND